MIKRILKKILGKKLLLVYHLVLAKLAAFYYGNPSEKLIVVGVTGTNGKTATVNFVAANILQIVPEKIDRGAASQVALPLFIPVQLSALSDVNKDSNFKLSNENIIILDKSVSCKDAKGLTKLGSVIPDINFYHYPKDLPFAYRTFF